MRISKNFDLNNIINNISKKIDSAVANTAYSLETDIRNTVSGGKRSGIKYKSLPDRSSAPGEPPAKQTGNLINNYNLRTDKKDVYRYRVILSADYARILEYGSPGGKLAPRPYVRPAVKRANKYLQKKLGSLR